MRKLLLLIVAIGGLYFYFTWQPSTSSIVEGMTFGEQVTYNGQTYYTDWGDSETATGYLRRIDRHYSKNMPIITYDLVVTTGDFSNPDIVELTHQGGGNYYWRAKTKPSGTLVIYHTIPSGALPQSELDGLEEGDTVTIQAKVSQNSEIKSDTGAFFKLVHDNHKVILVEDAL